MLWALPLAVGAVGMLGSALTKPKMPKQGAFTPLDIEAETRRILANREALRDPRLTAAMQQESVTALSLSRGEIPKEVQQQVRQAAAEGAVSAGLSADQFSRLTARDLGTTSLAMMKEGAALTAQLESIRLNNVGMAYDSALGKANQLYEQYVGAEQYKMAKYQEKARSHDAFWSSLTSMGTAAAGAYATERTATQARIDARKDILDARAYESGQRALDRNAHLSQLGGMTGTPTGPNMPFRYPPVKN
jgi:hypothetical protein